MLNNTYQLGLVSVSFRNKTPKEILEAMVEAKLTCIEWGSDVHAPCNNIEQLHEIAALQQEYGIFCSSYGTYFRVGVNPVEEIQDYITAAKCLGTNILRLWAGNKSASQMSSDEKFSFVNECKRLATIAEENDVFFCLECHQGTFTENCDDAVFLMEEVHSSHFRMYWQPFQWQTADDNRENAKKIAPYAEHIHVFNWSGCEKFPLGEAADIWRDYLVPFTCPRTLLLEFMPCNKLTELSTEAQSLYDIIGGKA